MFRTLELFNFILIILNSGLAENKEVVEDENKVVSVVTIEDKFKVLTGHLQSKSVVAWANFTNDQKDNGWMYLEISTNPAFSDEDQARAAGFAEGYLTRNSVHEYFKEFYTNDICKGEDGNKVCQYMKDQIKANDLWVQETVQEKAKSEPFWHMA